MPERYSDRMKEFVAKLLGQGALAGQPIVRRESQVLAFIKENGQQLQVAFRQPDLFPDISYEEAIRLLVTVLTAAVLREVEQTVQAAFRTVFGAGLEEHFRSEGLIDAESFRSCVGEQLRHKATRDAFYFAAQSVSGGFYQRYLPPALKRRKVIYNEVIRRGRINMEPTLLPGYIGFVALVRPFFWMRFPASGGQPVSLAEVAKNDALFRSVLPQLEAKLKDSVGFLPASVIRPGIESCLSAVDHPETSGSARLVGILVNRAADFNPEQKVDKGAETPDKSWFNINRRTAKFSGYDSQFLDELYQIAGEEGW